MNSSTLSDRAWKISFHSTLVKKNVIFRIYVKIYQMNVGHTIGHVINFINDPRFDHKWLVTASTKKCFTTRREFQDGTTNPIRRKWKWQWSRSSDLFSYSMLNAVCNLDGCNIGLDKLMLNVCWWLHQLPFTILLILTIIRTRFLL